ncbi:hypothetical protein Aru02nite_09560 [Actinocatenispora rupis]|uniref:Uncharacterized protein n=1 Tax=Actinocatenispora rupis TaxID=519421 RepID=A0A8J3J163_9ACTN|nr:hypothetical protein Aru02nite_09560 [Actinocatenispora rupis]
MTPSSARTPGNCLTNPSTDNNAPAPAGSVSGGGKPRVRICSSFTRWGACGRGQPGAPSSRGAVGDRWASNVTPGPEGEYGPEAGELSQTGSVTPGSGESHPFSRRIRVTPCGTFDAEWTNCPARRVLPDPGVRPGAEVR